MTNASLTETQQISSIPAATNFSAFSTKPGTCLAEQVGVNAPGNPKITTRLPAVRSRTEKPFGPTAQPSVATSMNSKRRSSGSVSPVLIMDRPFTESVLVTPAICTLIHHIRSSFHRRPTYRSHPNIDDDERY